MKKLLIVLIVLVLIIGVYLTSTGFMKREDVYIAKFAVDYNEYGEEIVITCGVASSAGYIRSMKQLDGGVKPVYVEFYSTFGGFNSSLGANNCFNITTSLQDTEIYFSRPNGGRQLVLVRNAGTGEWQIPKE